jgi:hypothetical protein
MGYRRSKGGVRKLTGVLFFLSLIVLSGFAIYQYFYVPAPEVEGTEAFRSLSIKKSINLKGRNMRSIEISIIQDGNTVVILKDIPEQKDKSYTLHIEPGKLGLNDGQAMTVVKASAGILKEVTYEINTTVDTVPPVLSVVRSPSVVDQGSCGFAVLSADDAESVYIKSGKKTFRAFKASPPAGPKSEPSLELSATHGNESSDNYYVFFPVLLDTPVDRVFYAVAEDLVGNRSIRALSTRVREKDYRASSITLSDDFIKQVIAPLLNTTEIQDPIGAFKQVNEDWRSKYLLTLIEISQNTERNMLWSGRFNQLKNSQVMATYGERRTYFYRGKKISESVHLGYDLASTANALVGAANSGIVVFAGDLGIYGNTVIIDHGLGLMSLYGHLSTILVKKGYQVKKGEIIARTGSTGLAGGDHLHFGILVHGYEVSPLYWWDSHWLKVNIWDQIVP